MRIVLVFLLKILYRIFAKVSNFYFRIVTYFYFTINSIDFKDFEVSGIPFLAVSYGGKCSIGAGFKMNNTILSNPIGRVTKCSLVVGNDAVLTIGNNVGMSSTAIVCHQSVTIGDHVKIGGGVVIYDTDFHSLDPKFRIDVKLDKKGTKTAPVIIEKGAFIGAHSMVLKGVHIGENVVIGAGSVVTKSIPSGQIWAGNPAKFIGCI